MKNFVKIIMVVVLIGVLLSGCNKKEKKVSHVEQGMLYIDTYEYDKAITEFEASIEGEEDIQLAYRGEGIAYLNKGEYEQATICFTKALQESHGKVRELETDISYYLAEAEYKNNNAKGAIEIYTNLLKMDKKNADAHYLRGLMYLLEGNVESGKEDFDKAISLNQKNYEFYILISRKLAEGGYASEGETYLKKALEIDGDKEANLLGRGKVNYYLGEYNTALTELRQANEMGSIEALYYLGLTYEKLNDIDGAIVQYEKYIENDSNNGQVYNQLGLCKLKKEDYQGALVSIQKGIKEGDGTAIKELLLNEIAVYEYLADFETAREKMEVYISSYPEDKEAAREYEFLKTR